MKDTQPLVSYVIPAYNHEKYICKSIESVIDQDYNNIELIIINDGSTDKTDEKIKNYLLVCQNRFARFKYISRNNKGLTKTLNEAMKWSKGKYFTGHASDDIVLPSKVSILVKEFEGIDESYAAVFGNAKFIDNNSKEIFLWQKCTQKNYDNFISFQLACRNFDYKDPDLFGSYKSLLEGNYLPSMSRLMRLDILKKIGGWKENNTIEDWEMWLKLSKKYKFLYVDKILALYRWHEVNSIKTMESKLVEDSIKLLMEEEKEDKQGIYKNIIEKTECDLYIVLIKNKKIKTFFKYFKFNKSFFCLKYIWKKVENIFMKSIYLDHK